MISAPMNACTRCGSVLAQGVCPKCLLEAELPPALVGGVLEVGDALGSGGMGTVFRARHLRLGRTVAVKFLPEALAADVQMRARFEREARTLALLSHPHIVQVHDFGTEDGESYLVMEYVEGEPLSRVGRVPVEKAVAWIQQVCDALAYAHERGVIHRDIKPANLLVNREGQVKVADFGIARWTQPAAAGWTLTAERVAVGTPHYLAPEALQGTPPDSRADVYAMAVVLYELITGHLPLGEFEPLPGGLDRVVRQALTADPNKRTPTAVAFRRELAALRFTGNDVADSLPSDEKLWLDGAAMLCALAAASLIWAVMVSITPRVVSLSENYPLIHFLTPLPDGRWVSRARFETGPILGAVALLSVAVAALALLRRHWRLAHLDRPLPSQGVPESRRLFIVGVLCAGTYGARVWLEHRGGLASAAYAPLLGGVLELAALFFLFRGMLQAWRISRPLSREPLILLGMGLALIPPVIEFSQFLLRWKP